MTTDDATEIEELVERAKAGDTSAFDALAAAHRAPLLAWIRSRLGSELAARAEPEDLVQETLLWAYRSIGRLEWRGKRAFESWLFEIARHVLLGAARTARRRPHDVLERDPAQDEPSPSRQLRRDERFERLQRGLRGLAPEHRKVIELARLRGLSTREIAERMGRSPNAVSQLLGRALRSLREAPGATESLGLPDRPLEPLDSLDSLDGDDRGAPR